MASEKAQLARKHLERAEQHVNTDATQAINWLHLSAEAAVVAMAEANGIETHQSHREKRDAAFKLFKGGHFSVDLSDRLRELNDARKQSNYDSLDPDLSDISVVDIYGEVQTAVDEAEAGT